MKTTKFFLMTTAMIVLSSAAFAQTATQIQQQKTEAASAGQAAATNAAAQDQAQKTQSATQDQAQKTQAASAEQAAKTQAAAQKQANETNATGQAVTTTDAAGQPTTVRIYNSGGIVPYYQGYGQVDPNAAGANQINQATQGAANATNSPGEKQLRDLFNTIDTNHDGLISMTEFSIYYKSPPDDPRFLGYDTNRDMMISYFEFRAPNVSGASVSVPAQ